MGPDALSIDLIYGSGLRSGFANTDHVPAYSQVNLGVAHELPMPGMKPLTLRFDIINVFDHVYELRDGSGIGVFAPQFGPRRGFRRRVAAVLINLRVIGAGVDLDGEMRERREPGKPALVNIRRQRPVGDNRSDDAEMAWSQAPDMQVADAITADFEMRAHILDQARDGRRIDEHRAGFAHQGAADNLGDHHRGGQRNDAHRAPLMPVVAPSEENVLVLPALNGAGVHTASLLPAGRREQPRARKASTMAGRLQN